MRVCGPQIMFILIVVMLGIGSMLSGCGKKGPLYLPERSQVEKALSDAPRKLAVAGLQGVVKGGGIPDNGGP